MYAPKHQPLFQKPLLPSPPPAPPNDPSKSPWPHKFLNVLLDLLLELTGAVSRLQL